MSDREDVLRWAREMVQDGNYVCFDTETTDLHGEIVQWAVVTPDGTLLGSGFVKPTEAISESAQAIHGISNEMVKDAPAFDITWLEIWRHLEGKTIVIFNAYFDVQRLMTSARPYGLTLPRLKTQCAMKRYAAFHGEWNEYYGDYRFQSLATACSALGIAKPAGHSAASDAQACAAVVRALAYLADKVEQFPEEARAPIVEQIGVELFDMEKGRIDP